MGKVNVCLKICFISLATLIGIISMLLLALTIFLHGYTDIPMRDEHGEIIVGLVVMYILEVFAVVLSIFGVYGAAKEKQWALILFAAGMGIATLLIFVDVGKDVYPERNKVLHKSRDVILKMPPSQIQFFQRTLKCCGLENGYQDWGSDIPESCLCEDRSVACVEAVWNATHNILDDHGKHVAVYAKPCLPILLAEVSSEFDATVGIWFGLAFLWGVSVSLSVAILWQLRKNVVLPTVTYSTDAKTGQYTTLCDTAELI